jgi:prevent-host-death family protein
MKTLSASEFKARCLAVLDEVARTGERVRVTKRGRAVADVGPPAREDDDLAPQQRIMGAVVIVGDVVSPVLPEEAWNALLGKSP